MCIIMFTIKNWKFMQRFGERIGNWVLGYVDPLCALHRVWCMYIYIMHECFRHFIDKYSCIDGSEDEYMHYEYDAILYFNIKFAHIKCYVVFGLE